MRTFSKTEIWLVRIIMSFTVVVLLFAASANAANNCCKFFGSQTPVRYTPKIPGAPQMVINELPINKIGEPLQVIGGSCGARLTAAETVRGKNEDIVRAKRKVRLEDNPYGGRSDFELRVLQPPTSC